MKINGIFLKDVMLNLSLGQFQSVPQEAEIDHSFSDHFEENIQRTNKKSQNVAWRFWQSPWNRTVVIVVLIVAILATTVVAFPAAFGIKQRHIPQVTETYYIPTYEPEGFTLLYRERYPSGVSYCWRRDDEWIRYHQMPGMRDSSSLVFDGISRETKNINGHSVEIITRKEGAYFCAIWRDEQYTYQITIDIEDDDPYAILCDFMDSLVVVNGKEKPIKLKGENTRYSICEKEGQHILVPNSPIRYDRSDCSHLYYPHFTSIAEMRQGIISGPLSEDELDALTHKAGSTKEEIMICDPDRLYECTAPAEFDLKYIAWYGTYYTFSLTGETSHGVITCCDEEKHTENFKYGYKDFLSNSLVTVTKQESSLDRFASVYYCSTSVAKLKYVCYELSVGREKMYVQEEYLLEHTDSDESVSSSVPSNIRFWGTENGGYFEGYFYDLTERPSVEWLSQFGIVRFVK